MIRLFSVLSILIVCALCFFVGYKIGKGPVAPTPHSVAPIVSEPVESLEALTVEVQPVTPEPATPEPTTPKPVQTVTSDPITKSLAERAKKDIQTFVDPNDRELVAQVLEVKADSLKVRRQIDGQVLDLPVNMLSTEDQTFANYLWTQQQSQAKRTTAAQTTSQAPEDIMWEALFND
jgi:hypothetical protein